MDPKLRTKTSPQTWALLPPFRIKNFDSNFRNSKASLSGGSYQGSERKVQNKFGIAESLPWRFRRDLQNCMKRGGSLVGRRGNRETSWMAPRRSQVCSEDPPITAPMTFERIIESTNEMEITNPELFAMFYSA